MKGGFDLYGKYYPDINDAYLAEMNQCNEIDLANANKKIKQLTQDEQEYKNKVDAKIESLEKELMELKSNIKH